MVVLVACLALWGALCCSLQLPASGKPPDGWLVRRHVIPPAPVDGHCRGHLHELGSRMVAGQDPFVTLLLVLDNVRQ